jgi:Tol biopolymer transport system component
MNLTAGARIGSYEVASQIGEGGMGIVFRAHDTNLQRDVALKLLPDHFADDPDRLARFRREAQVLASLNHPNIAQIYGLEGTDASRCIVMELVDGETLQERLKRGPIPLDEALPIAKQIAEALEAAHEKGITHRDLKPGNIKWTPEGRIKVLDFGLAKVREASGPATSMSNSPTLLSASVPGVIMGTAAYMSPEQAKGRPLDRRTDIFAFGCVLYEMLTGRPAFDGEDVAEILSKVLQRDPDWTWLPANVPPRIRELLRLCLQKDVRKRRSDAADVRIDIEQALTESGEIAGLPAASRMRERLWMGIAAVLLIGMAVLTIPAVRYFREAAPAAPPEMRLEINTPPTTNPASLAISPDGLKIVFAATSEGRSGLWIRSLGSMPARALPGTDGGIYPFWSPDSRSVGFFADGKLKRIDINGGSAQILANAVSGAGGAWNRQGVIVFAPTRISPIFRVSAKGGETAAVTGHDAQQSGHFFPQFLPDGEHFLYYARGAAEIRGVYIGQLDGLKTARVLDADSAAVYVFPGRLLFARGGALFAQDFDPDQRVLRGDPFPVAEQIALDAYGAGVSASSEGPVVFRTGSGGGQRQFVWFDRSGKEIEKLGSPDTALSSYPVLSPDSRRVALSRVVNGNEDVWLLDIGRGALSRFTFDPADDEFSIWSPDGSRIVFDSNRNGTLDLYQKPVSGAASEEVLLADTHSKLPQDWSPDGRFLLYRIIDPKTSNDLWVLSLDGDRKPFPVIQTKFDERNGQFSPDGKWIAYQSNESGRFEIYVQPFPDPLAKFQVSTNGGAQVRWRRDGKELFFIALDNRLMAAPIRLDSGGQALEAGAPVALFATHIGGAVGQDVYRQQYMVSPDGQRFLMNTIIEETTSPITVLLNWKAKP